jgi:hypothetical protein
VVCTDYSSEELVGQHASLLPEREALAWINLTNIIAINLAIAVNAATVGAVANAAINGQLVVVPALT